jgi:hypothetical protein
MALACYAWALTGGRALFRLVYDSGRSHSALVRWAFPPISPGESMVLERVGYVENARTLFVITTFVITTDLK